MLHTDKVILLKKKKKISNDLKYKFENILVYRSSNRHYRMIFIVAWITYIYVWQRWPDDERSISRNVAKRKYT